MALEHRGPISRSGLPAPQAKSDQRQTEESEDGQFGNFNHDGRAVDELGTGDVVGLGPGEQRFGVKGFIREPGTPVWSRPMA